MAFAAKDVVPLSQARANLPELAEQAKASTEKIITKNGESYVALIDAQRLDYYHQLARGPGMRAPWTALARCRLQWQSPGWQGASFFEGQDHQPDSSA